MATEVATLHSSIVFHGNMFQKSHYSISPLAIDEWLNGKCKIDILSLNGASPLQLNSIAKSLSTKIIANKKLAPIKIGAATKTNCL